LGLEYDGDECEFTTAERNEVIITRNEIYSHQRLHVNYTSYDLQRGQDSLNPRTTAYFMVLGCENEDIPNPHPYWYGRIIKIFHAVIIHTGPQSHSTKPKVMEFLWVRWLGRDMEIDYQEGWTTRRLPRIGMYIMKKKRRSAF
jgi:hypothetical protein